MSSMKFMSSSSSSSSYESMPCYLVPRLGMDLYQSMEIHFVPTDELELSSLSYYLSHIKTMIDTYLKDWDYFKRMTNPYEYIHTMVPQRYTSVANIRPLSRSFFKMIELLQTFDFGFSIQSSSYQKEDGLERHSNKTSSSITTFHLAEGPGGFIEALVYLRQNQPYANEDVYYGMTLTSKHNSNVTIRYDMLHGEKEQEKNSVTSLSESSSLSVSSYSHHSESSMSSSLSSSSSMKTTSSKSCHFPINSIHSFWSTKSSDSLRSKRFDYPSTSSMSLSSSTSLSTVSPYSHNKPPGWKKSRKFLRNHSNVRIETGMDGTGNILSMTNFLDVTQRYGYTMDFITADGGFDFSTDFNHQEENTSVLIFAQIAYALQLQKQGGSFILKIFDMLTPFTMDMMALLSSVYQHVYITKPNTSRLANSEKYIVCQHFVLDQTNSSSLGFKLRELFPQVLDKSLSKPMTPWRLLSSTHLPLYFQRQCNEYNAMLGQQQIEHIHITIQLITKSPGFEKKHQMKQLIQQHIRQCISWCIRYQIPMVEMFQSLVSESERRLDI